MLFYYKIFLEKFFFANPTFQIKCFHMKLPFKNPKIFLEKFFCKPYF